MGRPTREAPACLRARLGSHNSLCAAGTYNGLPGRDREGAVAAPAYEALHG